MLYQWLHLIVIGHMWTEGVCKSYYSIVAPGTVKSNRNYTVSVTLHAAPQPAVIRLGLSRSDSYFTFQDVSLRTGETKSVDFVLPKLSKDYKYELIAEGVRGIQFKNVTELLVDESDGLKIFIQTSKGIYKPGDLVEFRIIILNEHLKPVKLNEPVAVRIEDSKNHRVKQIKNIPIVKGLFSGNIQLSEQPNLGIWNVIVSVSGKYNLKEVKPFSVSEYVLPKYSVHLDAQDYFVREDLTFPVTVYGKYVFGKFVEGLVVAKIMIGKHVFETQMKEIAGSKAKFEFNVTKYIHNVEVEPAFDIEAALVEKYTNVTLISKKSVQQYNQRYKIVVPIEEIEFHNNRPHSIKAYVRYLNDSVVRDSTTPILMKHGGSLYESFLDANGSASFVFDYIDNKSNDFLYKKTSYHLANIFHSHQSNKNSMCNLKVKTGSINLGKVVEVEVSSELSIPYVVYALISHSNIIYTKYVQLESSTNSCTIAIQPSIELVPFTYLAVHYIIEDQLVYCDIKINFPQQFENKISITTPSINVEPGQEVTLNIQAEPQSRIGLLAVDLSVHLLNSNYSLDKKNIFRDLNLDQSYTLYEHIKFGVEAGLVLMTNAEDVFVAPTTDFGFHRRMMSSRNANSFDDQLQVRTKFPETWIFKEIEITKENTSLSVIVPDTMTTFLVTAISVNEKSGFGMTDDSLDINVFRPFFISTNLPYAIKRGELMAVSLTIFNFYQQSLSCKVIMNNTDGEFQFVEAEDNILNSTFALRHVTVAAESGSTVQIFVKALKLGYLNVRLTAFSSLAQDAIIQKLKVVPEGILISKNEEIYLNLDTYSTQKSTIEAVIPEYIVEGSEFLKISVGGETLMTSLENLNNLVLLPTGCGEQNMANFAPNILVLDYLKSVRKWQNYTDLVTTALNFIEIGYQRQLTYRHDNGGYSVFGIGGTESTWLTAYVVRFFIKAVRYVAIEPDIITSSLDFLASKQKDNGEIPNTGYLFIAAHQNRYGFTAYILLSFLESRKYRKQYSHVIEKGFEFLASNINNTNDAYALAIMSNVFQMGRSERAYLINDKLLALQQKDGDRKWWTSSHEELEKDVEITSYALMALLETNGLEHFSIFRWLLSERNENGGFKTTYDTVVGLQSIVKFNEKYHNSMDTTMNVTYLAKDETGREIQSGAFEITADNIMIWQQLELPRSTRFVEYEATGQGNVLLQFAYQYYEPAVGPDSKTDNDANITLDHRLQLANTSDNLSSKNIKVHRKQLRSFSRPQAFLIKPIAKIASVNKMLMEICLSFKPSTEVKLEKTNMIILEINLPSGFVCNAEVTNELLELELITKVELQNSDSKIVIYFDQLNANDEHCLQIHTDRVYEVQLLRPSTIEIYDYYNIDLRGSAFYEIKL